MSLLPISEALQRLDTVGLVESRPRAGTRVRLPAKSEVLERYMLREALESQAARLFSINATDKERDDLLKSGDQLDKLYAICDEGETEQEFLYSVRLKHIKFHLKIAEGGRCGLLQDAIEREQDMMFMWLSDRVAQMRPLPHGFHSVLAVAVASRDEGRADQAARDHIRYAAGQLVNVMDKPQSERWRRKRG